MKAVHEQKEAGRFLEGGVFYPTGHLVLGMPDEAGMRKARRCLETGGFDPQSITDIPAADMAREARRELDGVSLLSVGASIPAREMQLGLAREGCHFLLVFAPEDADVARAVPLLRGLELRYAVRYRRLVIENLLDQLDSTSSEQEPVRVS